MKNINTKLKIGIIIAAIIIIAVAVVFIYLSQKGGQAPVPVPTATTITGSVPSQGASGVSVFDPIMITFNQEVDPLTITVTSDPTESWSISRVSPNSIRIDHKLYLRVATTYKIVIMQHTNPIGTLTFETSHEQNDPRLLQTINSQLNNDYPLASLTPYETLNYRVVYSAPLTLEIDLKISMNPQDAISQVQLWVKSNGVDPGTHKYVVIAPSPTP